MNSTSISAAEIKAAISLAAVFFLRMLPLFMVLPVLAIAENDYQGTTPQLLGLALGVYGLTQATLQIPFGMLSDKFGRKPIIATGLIIFILGSLLAAMSESIYGLILGRALQGAGAVAAAIMALAADLSSEEHRTKVMAVIGISIGLSFSFAFVLGPLLFSQIGIRGLFYLGVGLALLAILTLFLFVPTAEKQQKQDSSPINVQNLKSVLANRQLLKLDISIFTTHLILMANFVVIPVTLRDFLQIPPTSHWQIYLGVIFASLFIMIPFISFGDRNNKSALFHNISILLIILSQAGLAFVNSSLSLIVINLILFFGAFNYLEALLPSEVSKTTEAHTKGTALGVYSSSQFIGIFIGGLIGGLMQQKFGIVGVHASCLFVAVIWLLINMTISQNIILPDNQFGEEKT